jgi:hypothetical protein
LCVVQLWLYTLERPERCQWFGGGGGVWYFTEVCFSGGRLAPIQNFTACFTEANFISVYMGLYPVPRPSFFSQLAGKEKWSPDTHVIKCLCPTTAFMVHGCNSDWLFLAWVFMPYLMYCFDNWLMLYKLHNDIFSDCNYI